MIPFDVAVAVDQQVNAAIAPAPAEWPDVWRDDTPASGDCEDYALSKRRRLLDMGFDPLQTAPLLTYGTWHDPGHMRLAVHTDRGWLVLDNLAPPVPYRGDIHDLLVGTQWHQVADDGSAGRKVTAPYQWRIFCETRRTDPGCN